MLFYSPQKNNYILINEDIISSSSCQKLEFSSKKYPNFHTRLTSFTLKKSEWYQIGSIYTFQSNIFLSLRLQKIKSSRQWMRERIEKELNKIALVYDDPDDQPILKNRSVECLASDLNKKCIIFSNLKETLKARDIMLNKNNNQFRRWENLEIS